MKTTDQDPWKSFVDENREGFEQRKPRNLWPDIEDELSETQQKPALLIQLWKIRKIAALFILSLGLGYFAMYLHFSQENQLADQQKEEKKEGVDQDEEGKIEQELPREFLEVESYYVAEIDKKLEELIDITDNDIIVEEINLLKAEFDELKKELGDHINDERIIEAMIKNYRLRLELLKEILEELKSKKEIKQNKSYENTAT